MTNRYLKEPYGHEFFACRDTQTDEVIATFRNESMAQNFTDRMNSAQMICDAVSDIGDEYGC